MIAGIGSWLTKREFLTPDKEALVEGTERLTYKELNRRVNRLCRALQQMGLDKGDRIGILSTNRVEFVQALLAAAKLGLIVVPLNWRLTPSELAFNVTDSGTDTLLMDSGLADLAEGLVSRVSLKRVVAFGENPVPGTDRYDELLASQSEDEPEIGSPPDLNSPHIIMYTAGTTGKPKGAVLTQGASFWNALNLNLSMDFTSADRDLLVLPLFHIGGIGLFTLPMLYVGGTVVLQRTFDAAHTLELLRKENISLFFGVPAVFLLLIQHPDFSAEAFENVRLVMSGGAPLPVDLVRRYHEKGIVLRQGFGMSEAAPSIATLSKESALEKAGSIGRAVFHLEARVVDDDMQDVVSGHVGELVIRGPNLMKAYWNRPDATEEAFAGGWFHTGDLARMDKDGDLYIVERKKDMFISGGENVYPAEVENAIYENPMVAEVAVIGVKDEKWGEAGCAVVVPKPGESPTREDILDPLKGRLAKYKIPKSVVLADQLPRNAAGKVLKTVLREKQS